MGIDLLHKSREAVGDALAVLVGGVLDEPVGEEPWLVSQLGTGPSSLSIGGVVAYAGALVVLRKVERQIWHWISQAWAFYLQRFGVSDMVMAIMIVGGRENVNSPP